MKPVPKSVQLPPPDKLGLNSRAVLRGVAPERLEASRRVSPLLAGSLTNGSHGEASGPRRISILPAHLVARALENPVLRGLLPLAVSFSQSASGDIREPAIRTGQTDLLYCSRGSGWAELRGRRHAVFAGDLVVLPSSEPRVCGAEAGRPWTLCCVRAAGANLDFFLAQLGASAERPVLKVGEDPRLLRWFAELMEVIGPNCGSAELLYASQTLAHLLSALICRRRENRHQETDAARKIEETITYMRQHLDEPLRASVLAAVANMSLPHYFVLFKRETGCTPIDYFINLRMRHARHLLVATSWSVKEVAAALGYEDPLYFSRVFKSTNHITPTQYRLEPNDPENGADPAHPHPFAISGEAGIPGA